MTTRYVCDNCGVTADNEVPANWSSVQVMQSVPGPPGSGATSVLHVCPLHDVVDLIGGAAATSHET
jgi:hypothetical protein